MLDPATMLGDYDTRGMTRAHLLTRVDRYDLAFPIDALLSVHEAPLVTPVPSAQPGILGGVRVHGQAVPVADLRRCLRLEPRAVSQNDRLLLLRSDGRTVGAVVDEVKTIVDVPRGTLEGPDPLFDDTPVNTRVIVGLAAVPELCAVVDVDALLLPDPWDDDEVERLLAVSYDDAAPLAARTAALASAHVSETETGLEAAVFLIGGQRYGVPVVSVVEFFRELPHSPLVVRGGDAVSLVNRRGDALALYDIRSLLGLPPRHMPELVNGIVVGSGAVRAALAVDELAGLETLPPAGDSMYSPGRFCASIHAGPNGAVQLLDVAALMAAPQLVLGSEGSL